MPTTTGLISKNQKEQILKATDIVQLIGGYVQLKASGKNYVGLCPFHKEKTPSFTVSSSHQNYKCYGCGEYGDAIRFVMEIENFPFVEAVQFLGDRCGVSLTFDKNKRKVSGEQSQVNHCLSLSFDYFRQCLKSPKINSPIQDYLARRTIGAAEIEKFELGYVPKGWTNLHDHLNKLSISREVQENAGLIKKGDKGGYYDRLRNRLIFPIRDQQGRIIGFAGRALDGELPKYLNPPETDLYKKTSVLYGLHQAKDRIRKTRRAFIVEGYLDLIRLFEESWEETVASCGTALTPEHIGLIKRFGATVAYLVFDGDKAGVAAAEKSASIFMASDLDSKVIILPDELDPDDYFKQYQAEDFQKLIDTAPYEYEFLIDQTRKDMAGMGIEQQKQAVESILKLADTIKEDIKRELFLSRISTSFNLNKQSLNHRVGQWRDTHRENRNQNETWRDPTHVTFEKPELPEVKLIQYIINHRQSIGLAREILHADDFFNAELSRLYARFLQLSNQEFNILESKEFPNIFVEYSHILAFLLHYRIEYSGPTIQRRRLPEDERDKEIVTLESDNRNRQSNYSEAALKKLIRRVKQQKLTREKKGLYQIDIEQERERVAALSQRRKQMSQ